jgi:hypothetical protein
MRTLLLIALLGCSGDSDDEIPPVPDDDNDGYSTEEGDCNDADASVNPGVDDDPHDGIDYDCDGRDEYDWDGDGYRYDEDDCNDTDELVNPEGTERCNHVDDDCDGETDEDVGTVAYRDEDRDGYGTGDPTGTFCDLPDGSAENADDCDDFDATVNPGQQEMCGDGRDNDCDDESDEDC